MMEGIVQTMLFFLGLRVLLSQQSKDDDMGKRSKNRKNKYANKSDAEQELNNVVRKSERQRLREEKQEAAKAAKKPYEDVVLPPPRDAQKGIV